MVSIVFNSFVASNLIFIFFFIFIFNSNGCPKIHNNNNNIVYVNIQHTQTLNLIYFRKKIILKFNEVHIFFLLSKGQSFSKTLRKLMMIFNRPIYLHHHHHHHHL
jgi:hypothetical protein